MLVKSVTESEGWREVENMMRAVIKRKKTAQSSLNWDDPPEVFIAFKERAPFMAGFVQGAEYILNDIRACLAEEADIKQQVKETEKELKQSKAS